MGNIMDIASNRKIKKDKLVVAILTQDYRIEGEVHVLPDSRLTDFVNSKTNEDFIAVTHAEIISLSKNMSVSKVEYLAINKSYITLVYPLDS
jgi:hypothetical protein